jgi:methionyl-tRNA formyltransferase
MGVGGHFSCYLIGSESLLVQCAEILLERGHEISGVASHEPAITAWARGRGIATVDPDGDLVSAFAGEFDYLFSITNLKVLPEAVLRLPRRAAINFHDGPLPRYAGLYTPAWALMNRETSYGITWHVMKAAVDEGELLAQRFFDVSPGETSLTINTKCYEAAIDSFGPLCDALASGSAASLPQNLSQKSYFGKWQRPAGACVLDFALPALQLEALVCALDFGRYENPLGAAKLHHRGRVFAVASAQARDTDGSATPGTLIAIESDALIVATGAGALRLADFSEPRGLRVAISDLVAALGIAPGARLDGASDGLGERLGALNADLCRSEAFWVKRLASLDPLEPPYVRSERAGAGAHDWRELALDVPAAFLARYAGGGDALIAGFVAWLARLCDRTGFDLAFRDDALRARVAGLEAFAADVVPLRIALDDTGTAESALASSLDAIARTRKRVTFLHDAVSRFPRLRGNTELASGRLLPLLAEIRDDARAIKPAAGTLLALIASRDGRSARFGYDARALDDASANALRAQWLVFLQAAANAPHAGEPSGELRRRDTVLS